MAYKINVLLLQSVPMSRTWKLSLVTFNLKIFYNTTSDTKPAACLFRNYDGQEEMFYIIRWYVPHTFVTDSFKVSWVALKKLYQLLRYLSRMKIWNFISIKINACCNFYLHKCAVTLELLKLVFFASLYVRLLYLSGGGGTLVSTFQIHFAAKFTN